MKDYMEERVQEIADYFTSETVPNPTVREAAEAFGISKSTVHKDMCERLQEVSYLDYMKVQEILQKNKEERHLRGGEATRRKYLNHSKNN